MPEYIHGIKVVEATDGTRPLRTVSTAVIGAVCTADDADATAFPLDTPVLITNLPLAQSNAGTGGTLVHTLDAIADQTNPMIVMVRVAEDADPATQEANVVAGVQALLNAESALGVKPRILGAPGLDTQNVANELVTTAQKLRAFAYVFADGATDKESAVAYRGNFSARELMVIWPDFTNTDAAGTTTDLYAAARALGLRAKIDKEDGWQKTISNVAVNGVTGIGADLWFDLQNESSDTNYLNANEVTTLIRHDGFRFWGSRTCSDDPLFAFENYTRTAQVIADTVAEGHMWAIDKPMSKGLITDMIEGINAKLREMKSNGYILGGKAWYSEEANTPENLKDGKLVISYDYCPVPPIEGLTLKQYINDEYLAEFSASVAA